MLTAGCTARVAVVIRHAAACKGFVNLGVQILTVGQNQKREIAAELAMNLAGKKYHRVALAGALGMPEYPQPALPVLAILHRLDGPIDAQELVVAGQYFL